MLLCVLNVLKKDTAKYGITNYVVAFFLLLFFKETHNMLIDYFQDRPF